MLEHYGQFVSRALEAWIDVVVMEDDLAGKVSRWSVPPYRLDDCRVAGMEVMLS